MATSASHESTTINNPPEGWTVDPDDMRIDYYWSNNGPGQMAAATYILKDPVPLMSTVVKSGTPMFLFASGGKLYIWNIIEDVVWEIQTPGSPQNIADRIGNDGIVSLKIEEASTEGGEFEE